MVYRERQSLEGCSHSQGMGGTARSWKRQGRMLQKPWEEPHGTLSSTPDLQHSVLCLLTGESCTAGSLANSTVLDSQDPFLHIQTTMVLTTLSTCQQRPLDFVLSGQTRASESPQGTCVVFPFATYLKGYTTL